MARKWWTLIAVCVATFILLLDITVVNVALPSIREDLDANFKDLQWVIDAYALTLAAFVLTSGSLADRLGRRRVFTVGLVVFTVASALCALSTGALMLNCSRALQGVGGAIMFAVSLALLAQEFRGDERARATAIYGATIGLAIVVGPLAGGALTDGIGWRSIFYLNVPIGIAAILITVTRVAESRDPQARGIDWWGLVIFSLANTLLVFTLIRVNDYGWGSAEVLGGLAGAAVLFASFVLVESRSAQPMLPLEYFRNRSFTGAQIGAVALSGSMFALYLYITLFVQNILGYSPFESGLIYLPSATVSLVVSGATAAAMTRVPFRILLSGGLAITALGLVILSGREAGDSWTGLLPGFLVTGLGVGMINPVIANLALSTVPDEHSGVASGINDTFRQVAIATGVAAFGALLLSRATDHITSSIPAIGHSRASDLAEAVSSGGLPAGVPAPVLGAAQEGFVSGLNEVLLLGAGLALVGALLTFVLVRTSDVRKPDPASS